MAPRKKKTQKQSNDSVVQGESVVIPAKAPILDSGAAGIAQPQAVGKRQVTASVAGSADNRFAKGGKAFAVWCQRQGIAPSTTRTEAEWQDLLEQFAKRAIHGHRRGSAGGNHRLNPQHTRS